MIPTDTNMNVLISYERDETSILLRKNLDELTQDMHEIGYSNVNIEFGENSQSALSTSSLANVADWIGKSAKIEEKLWFDGNSIDLEFDLPIDATRGELVIQTQTGNEVFRTNVDPEDRKIIWSGTHSNGAYAEYGSYRAILIPFQGDDPLPATLVFSFQKLVEAGQGKEVATLLLESGEAVAPQEVIALR